MKRSVSDRLRRALAAALLPVATITSAFAGGTTDSIATEVAGSYRYDKRVHRYRKGWAELIPTHTVVQYAGSIGLLSAGLGWDYGSHSQWETSLLWGYLPRYNSDSGRMTFTIKQNYTPWSLTLHRHPQASVEPLTCGLFFNTIFSDEFWVQEPDRYPKGYYGFSTRVRTHIFIGQRFTYRISPHSRFFAKSVTAYYELSTCDLYVVSAFTNSYLKPRDILSLSFGLKVQLF